jgi:hypothetical protein
MILKFSHTGVLTKVPSSYQVLVFFFANLVSHWFQGSSLSQDFNIPVWPDPTPQIELSRQSRATTFLVDRVARSSARPKLRDTVLCRV